MTPTSLARMRALVAHTVLSDAAHDARLGAITLRPAQLTAVARARRALAEFGGVLIAERVGAGKTYTALALCRSAARPLIVAPATLREMWAHATRLAGVDVPVVSVESLGRSRNTPSGHDVIVFDEAHHLRNPATRRYRAAAAMAARARVILLTATPVHNCARDLDALLALFLGARARDLDANAQARLIVRTTTAARGPAIVTHEPVAVRDSARITEAVRALPSPVPVRDGGVALALTQMSLLRAWCSSAGAFAAQLRHAALRAAALADALRAGRHPSRAELAAWSVTGDGQMAFAELVTTAHNDAVPDLSTVTAHLEHVNALRTLARAHLDRDAARAAAVAGIAAAHPGVSVLACTQYAETVRALWSALRRTPGVAALTSRGARIASGAITRAQALARFAPVAMGAPIPHDRERITLLITTDLVSEGLNLHDAGVVIHLDLPWTDARLTQRVGRVARSGSRFERVHAYRIEPPRAAAAMLALERRVRAKQRIAARVTGMDATAPAARSGSARAGVAPADAWARIIEQLQMHSSPTAPHPSVPAVCAIAAPVRGWLAVATTPTGPRLATRLGSAVPTTDPALVATAVDYLTTHDEVWLPASWERIERDALRWLARERAAYLAGAHRTHEARAHGGALATIARSVRDAPPHIRAEAARGASEQFHPLARADAGRGDSHRLAALIVFCTDATQPHPRAGRAVVRP